MDIDYSREDVERKNNDDRFSCDSICGFSLYAVCECLDRLSYNVYVKALVRDMEYHGNWYNEITEYELEMFFFIFAIMNITKEIFQWSCFLSTLLFLCVLL